MNICDCSSKVVLFIPSDLGLSHLPHLALSQTIAQRLWRFSALPLLAQASLQLSDAYRTDVLDTVYAEMQRSVDRWDMVWQVSEADSKFETRCHFRQVPMEISHSSATSTLLLPCRCLQVNHYRHRHWDGVEGITTCARHLSP